MQSRGCEHIHGNNGNDEQGKDHQGDDDVGQFIDARRAVEGDVLVRGLCTQFRRLKIALGKSAMCWVRRHSTYPKWRICLFA